MKTAPSLRGIKKYVMGPLHLRSYFSNGGDGRLSPRKPASALLWAFIAGQLLRQTSFHSVEGLVHAAPLRNLGVTAEFGDDTLAYFSERLDPARTRQALTTVLHRAKRNKAFESSAHIGLALDGTTVARCQEKGCELCRPRRDAKKQIIGYRHHLAMISVVGAGICLPFDIEPYAAGDSEYAAAQRLLRRAVAALHGRFADYIVVDAGLSTATFLHAASEVGLPVLARLKENLPELAASVEQRFGCQRPHRVSADGNERVELWDADDFDPWETLKWPTVRGASVPPTETGRYRCSRRLAHKPAFLEVPLAVGFSHGQSPLGDENQGFNAASRGKASNTSTTTTPTVCWCAGCSYCLLWSSDVCSGFATCIAAHTGFGSAANSSNCSGCPSAVRYH